MVKNQFLIKGFLQCCDCMEKNPSTINLCVVKMTDAFSNCIPHFLA